MPIATAVPEVDDLNFSTWKPPEKINRTPSGIEPTGNWSFESTVSDEGAPLSQTLVDEDTNARCRSASKFKSYKEFQMYGSDDILPTPIMIVAVVLVIGWIIWKATRPKQ